VFRRIYKQDSPVIIRIVRALIDDFAFFFKNGERSEKKEEASMTQYLTSYMKHFAHY